MLSNKQMAVYIQQARKNRELVNKHNKVLMAVNDSWFEDFEVEDKQAWCVKYGVTMKTEEYATSDPEFVKARLKSNRRRLRTILRDYAKYQN